MAAPYERNPFHVLELTPDASALQVERAGQKLLAMLSVGLEGAGRYPAPGSVRTRDEPEVRWAMAELRDPGRRARWARWWTDPAVPLPAGPERPDPFVLLGWRP